MRLLFVIFSRNGRRESAAVGEISIIRNIGYIYYTLWRDDGRVGFLIRSAPETASEATHSIAVKSRGKVPVQWFDQTTCGNSFIHRYHPRTSVPATSASLAVFHRDKLTWQFGNSASTMKKFEDFDMLEKLWKG
jgi:hypothetical protein